MFSFLQGKMLTVIGSVAVCSLIWGGLASWGYVSSQKDLSSLKEQYNSLKIDYDKLSEERDTLLAKKDITDSVVVGLYKELNNIEDEKDTVLVKLKELSKKSCPRPTITETGEVIETVDINMPFSDEYRNAIRLSAPNP